MKKKIDPFIKGFMVVTVIAALLIFLFLINQLFAELEKRNVREPISQVDYSQQAEMKENLSKEGRFDTIIFEFDNDSVKFIY